MVLRAIDLEVHLERYCNVLAVFGFNSANYELNLIKSYLLPNLVDERNNEHSVNKKANQFISKNFRDVQLLDIMNFPTYACRSLYVFGFRFRNQ